MFALKSVNFSVNFLRGIFFRGQFFSIDISNIFTLLFPKGTLSNAPGASNLLYNDFATSNSGEIITKKDEIIINKGKNVIELVVSNSGDRPIQVGSHFHFFETNVFLIFDRDKTKGMRLNIPSGTAIRFEPGQQKQIQLVAFSGNRKVYGFNQKIMGDL